ncbi:transposase [Vulcanibacillus modesticaldus]|uniref:Transposase n=1 Tax=Vulcanibacillus modesticaldus TaxID=337097 RepID=A0A1D2YS84_9BACI|nr:transposase [Vulcanibacillus modesticaldus]
MKRKGVAKKYTEDFKQTIVELYNSGTPVKKLSSEYGVSEVTIYKWIRSYTPVGEGKDSLTPKEIEKIQKENLRLKQEIEILKKAMTIFAKK